MDIAALLSFGTLLIAWIVAPNDSHPRTAPNIEPMETGPHHRSAEA